MFHIAVMLFLRNGVNIIFKFASRNLHPYSTQDRSIPDYYGVLGVPRDATSAEIKKSFLELSKLYHPDLNLDNKEKATKKFLEVKEAYSKLYDQASRDKYDFRLDNIFSAKTFDDILPKSYHTRTPPPPMHIPVFIKWLDKTFPTYDARESSKVRREKHFKVIFSILAICFLWYAIHTWRIRSFKNSLRRNLNEKSAENERYLEEVKRRARGRNHWDHLAELKRVSDARTRKKAEPNSQK